jgi:hypothetical protein
MEYPIGETSSFVYYYPYFVKSNIITFADEINLKVLSSTCSEIKCAYCEKINSTICKKCHTGFFLFNDSCVSICPIGYFADNLRAKCVAESSTIEVFYTKAYSIGSCINACGLQRIDCECSPLCRFRGTCCTDFNFNCPVIVQIIARKEQIPIFDPSKVKLNDKDFAINSSSFPLNINYSSASSSSSISSSPTSSSPTSSSPTSSSPTSSSSSSSSSSDTNNLPSGQSPYIPSPNNSNKEKEKEKDQCGKKNIGCKFCDNKILIDTKENVQKCIKCKDDYFLYVGRCFEKCPENTNENFINRICEIKPLCTIENCGECSNSSTCKTCKNGYYKYENQCITKCPDNYRADRITWSCLKAPIFAWYWVYPSRSCRNYCGLVVQEDWDCSCSPDCFYFGNCCQDIDDYCENLLFWRKKVNKLSKSNTIKNCGNKPNPALPNKILMKNK